MKIICLIFTLILSLFAASGISAQNSIVPDNRLSIKYSQEYLSNLIGNSPETLDYLNYSLDNSCYLINEDSDKFKNCQQLKFFDNTNKISTDLIVPSIDFSNINICLFNLELKYNQRTFYRIGNSNQILAFYSLKEMAERYNNFKKSVK